jgi:hypothetical protein
LWNSVTIIITTPNIVLSISITLLCSFQKPLCSFKFILFYSFSIVIENSYLALCSNIALFIGFQIPLRCFVIIFFNFVSIFINTGKCGLRLSITALCFYL